MCLQGFPQNYIRDSMCPIIIRGSRPGAVQVLKTDSSGYRCVTSGTLEENR